MITILVGSIILNFILNIICAFLESSLMENKHMLDVSIVHALGVGDNENVSLGLFICVILPAPIYVSYIIIKYISNNFKYMTLREILKKK